MDGDGSTKAPQTQPHHKLHSIDCALEAETPARAQLVLNKPEATIHTQASMPREQPASIKLHQFSLNTYVCMCIFNIPFAHALML